MAVISWDNYVDDATITNNSSGSNVLAATKLQTRQIGDVFRQTITLTSPLSWIILDFDLGSAKATDLICILNHNMQGYAYTISFGSSSGGAEVGTSSGTLWTGTAYDAGNDMIYLSSAYTARYVRIAVKIPAAKTVDIGRVWLDSAWSFGAAMDFSMGVIDRSTKTKSRGGSSYVSDRQKLRNLDCRAVITSSNDLYGSSSDTLMKSFLTMDLAVGQSGEIVCIPMIANQHERQRTGVYGTISRNNPIRVVDKGGSGYLATKDFTVEEDRG
jgi:hypothetical protein